MDQAIRALFSPTPGVAYLDSATYGLPPEPTTRAMSTALDAWRSGSADWVADWDRPAEDARVSWNAMATARGRVKRLAEKVEADQGVIDAYREQFLVGRRDLLDLLDAHNELFISRSDLVTEEYTALLSAYRVLASGGRLLATLGIEQPSEGTTPAAKPLLGQPVLE